VEDGTPYPSVLVMTGESDTRVDPLHARKMAARLEAATARGDTHPVLLRVERKAGHGQGMPLSKAIEGIVDFHCFLEWQLGG
jgi:prolyl oligopeptidase